MPRKRNMCGSQLSIYNPKPRCYTHDLEPDTTPVSKYTKFLRAMGIICQKRRWYARKI